MSYCPKCGRELPDGSTYCPECGERIGDAPEAPQAANTGYGGSRPLPVTTRGNTVTGEKSAAVTVILSVLLAGIGTVYAGDTKKGIVEFVCMIVLTAVFLWVFWPILIAMFVLWLYCLFDSYGLCKENNTLWHSFLQGGGPAYLAGERECHSARTAGRRCRRAPALTAPSARRFLPPKEAPAATRGSGAPRAGPLPS